MFAEVNKLVARYGVDPGEFTLLPFGGAGPMLGCLLARELGIPRVMVPRRPGVVSALGGLVAEVKNDFIRTVFLELAPEAVPDLRAALATLRAEAEQWLRGGQAFAGAASFAASADMRYRGQSFEIETPLEAAWLETGDLAVIAAAFHQRHEAIYAFADPAAPVQLVNLRLVAAGQVTPPVFATQTRQHGAPTPERTVEVWQGDAFHPTPLYHRDALHHGHTFPGPAVVTQEDSTICIPTGYACTVDAHGNLHLAAED